MRVLIVGSVSADTGGIAQYINEQVRRLDISDIQTHDITPPLGSGPVWLIRAILFALIDAARFPFYSRPDLVHIHTSHNLSFFRASFYVLFTKYVWRRPVVLHIHGSSFDTFINTNSRLLARFQTVVFDATSSVIVLSSYWEKQLSTRVSAEKIHKIPNAVDTSEYEPQWDDSVPHVVFISNLLERKGIIELTDAIRQLEGLNTQQYKVTVAGKGPLSENVSRFSDKFDFIEYRGFVSEKEKRAIIGTGTIYVLPSHAEGLPIAILEGMAGGNAIISTTVGSIPEVISDQNGILVEPGNVDSLVDALHMLISDKKKTEMMGRYNRAVGEECYSWDVVLQQLQAVYEDCVK